MSIYILIIDYILGIVMWTLIGRSAMNIFQREDSEFFFMKVFVKYTEAFYEIVMGAEIPPPKYNLFSVVCQE